MKLKIVIAPSGFKESLDSEEVARCIETGIRRVTPNAKVQCVPMVDGGEGFTKALVKLTNGKLHELKVTGPVGQPVDSHFGFLGGKGKRTAIIEMAAAAGLRLVPRDQRNPMRTTTYGVGELIRAALDAGAERLLIGCGDSGTNDGGAGIIQALGGRLLDADGNELGRGGSELVKLTRIDLSGLDKRIRHLKIDVACNWHNVLCGPKGVARVFGPQKGGTPETVEQMAASLDNYAAVIQRDLGMDVRTIPGGGASGGMGAGIAAALGATLHPRWDIVMQYIDLNKLLKGADMVFTAEGALDYQTPHGKVPTEVARRAKKYNLPVIALAGTVGRGAEANYESGIDAFTSILSAPVTLETAIENAEQYLTDCAERVMRKILIGYRLARKSA
jgi:glycerate kinase